MRENITVRGREWDAIKKKDGKEVVKKRKKCVKLYVFFFRGKCAKLSVVILISIKININIIL